MVPQGSNTIRIGDPAPDFCLPDGLSGEEICLDDYLGSKLYIVFLRGSW